MTMTPSKYYLSLLLTISMIFISHAISPTSSSKLYQNAVAEPGFLLSLGKILMLFRL
jgi:hypothetical protein